MFRIGDNHSKISSSGLTPLWRCWRLFMFNCLRAGCVTRIKESQRMRNNPLNDLSAGSTTFFNRTPGSFFGAQLGMGPERFCIFICGLIFITSLEAMCHKRKCREGHGQSDLMGNEWLKLTAFRKCDVIFSRHSVHASIVLRGHLQEQQKDCFRCRLNKGKRESLWPKLMYRTFLNETAFTGCYSTWYNLA